MKNKGIACYHSNGETEAKIVEELKRISLEVGQFGQFQSKIDSKS